MPTIVPEVVAEHAQHVHLLTTQLEKVRKHADGTGESTQWALGGMGQIIGAIFQVKVGSVQDVIDALGTRAEDVSRRIDHTAAVFRFSESANVKLADMTKDNVEDPDLFHMPQEAGDFPDMQLSMDIANFAEFVSDYHQHGALPVALASAGMLFDVLGWALDPVGNVFGEFAGLIIDLIVPVKKMLDLLLGDPGALQNASKAYNEMAHYLSDIAHTFAGSLSQITPQTWDQPGASDVYLKVANNLVQAMISSGTAATDLSGDVLMMGSAIGDVRNFLFGLAVEFVMEAIFEAALGTSFAAVTFGASLATAAGIIETRAMMTIAACAVEFLGLMTRFGAAAAVASSQSNDLQKMVADIKH